MYLSGHNGIYGIIRARAMDAMEAGGWYSKEELCDKVKAPGAVSHGTSRPHKRQLCSWSVGQLAVGQLCSLSAVSRSVGQPAEDAWLMALLFQAL